MSISDKDLYNGCIAITRVGVLMCTYTEHGPGDFFVEYGDGTRRTLSCTASDELYRAGCRPGDQVKECLEVTPATCTKASGREVFGDDYKACIECGYDHTYEHDEANKAHQLLGD